MARLLYLKRSVLRHLALKERFSCPNCRSPISSVVDRKFLVNTLRRCGNCALLFRAPTDDPADNEAFYETEYSQGFTTDMPDDDELRRLTDSMFLDSDKDYRGYLKVLSSLGFGAGARIFDFGCSWGYGSYQLQQAGMAVTSFEVAPTRRRYAKEKLDVSTIEAIDEAPPESFDCFFSAHVLEHVPSPGEAIRAAWQLLKSGGVFVAFTPNGASEARAANPDWSKLWGEVHPNFLDPLFYNLSFSNSPRAYGSTPVESPSLPDAAEARILGDLSGGELLFIARKSGSRW